MVFINAMRFEVWISRGDGVGVWRFGKGRRGRAGSKGLLTRRVHCVHGSAARRPNGRFVVQVKTLVRDKSLHVGPEACLWFA